ncbi:hypothetical protein AB0N05_07615 [Nocardia sp. NPDC051030]|uniref:hypothetical protein n=1 Tax=Nocardia sp. NPDC051030 TaxID=3155162 RepID=UPI00341263FC
MSSTKTLPIDPESLQPESLHAESLHEAVYTEPTPPPKSILDSVDWPGLALLFVGIVTLGLAITLGGSGSIIWSVIGVGAMCAGAAEVLLECRRHLTD